MVRVLLALLPALLAQSAAFGPWVAMQVLAGVMGALIAEVVVLSLGQRSVPVAAGDGSAAVTGALIGLCITPLAPLWVSAAGAAAGVVIGKHAYGGLGRNPFNPAMVGYALVLVSFPAHLGSWPAAVGMGEIDAITAATPLDVARHAELARVLGIGVVVPDSDPWPWIGAAYALGGAWLIAVRAADGWLAGGLMLGVVITAGVLHLLAAGHDPLFHLLHGAVLCGAFFIITDPVSAPAGRRARLIFAMTAGALTVAIREFGGYPDGLAFAVLLANAMGPVLERVFGGTAR